MTKNIQGLTAFTIDYGSSLAVLVTPLEGDSQVVIHRFHELAGQCFGIRKSITKDPEIIQKEAPVEFPNWAPKGTYETLTHNIRSGCPDTIAWNKEGKKVKDEWS